MSFREKSAWITLISILLVSFLYFTHVPQPFDPDPGEWELMVIGLAIAAFVVIEIIAHIVLYVRFPKEARTPKDEREYLIDLRATRLAALCLRGRNLPCDLDAPSRRERICGRSVRAACVRDRRNR